MLATDYTDCHGIIHLRLFRVLPCDPWLIGEPGTEIAVSYALRSCLDSKSPEILRIKEYMLSAQPRPTAVFALTDYIAILVLRAAHRSDIAIFFLVAHATLLLVRAVWLGDPLAIPLHQLQSGSLLIFSFFMISDPRTTPDSRSAPCAIQGSCRARAIRPRAARVRSR